MAASSSATSSTDTPRIAVPAGILCMLRKPRRTAICSTDVSNVRRPDGHCWKRYRHTTPGFPVSTTQNMQRQCICLRFCFGCFHFSAWTWIFYGGTRWVGLTITNYQYRYRRYFWSWYRYRKSAILLQSIVNKPACEGLYNRLQHLLGCRPVLWFIRLVLLC